MKTTTLIIAIFCLPILGHGAISISFYYDPGPNRTIVNYLGSFDINSNDSATFSSQLITAGSTSFLSLPATTVGAADKGFTLYYPWVTAGNATSRVGDPFGITQGYVYGPENFTSETVISGGMEYSGKNLTDLGLRDGQSGTLTGSAGTINWAAVAGDISAVPEPGGGPFIASLFAMSALTLRLRKKTEKGQ
jgi:hypothetical protein